MGKGRKGDLQHAGEPEQHALATASGDPLSTLFLDFDWADEVLRVHLARRVLAHAFDTTAERDAAGARAAARLERIVEQDRALERSDRWPEFCAGVSRVAR